MTDRQAAYPPDYIKLPPAIACADEDDAVLITMACILGLCWGQKYRKSPPYTPDQLADLLGRPQTTLYHHLNRTNRTTGNRPILSGSRRSPTSVNSPDWKVISSILGCRAWPGTSAEASAPEGPGVGRGDWGTGVGDEHAANIRTRTVPQTTSHAMEEPLPGECLLTPAA